MWMNEKKYELLFDNIRGTWTNFAWAVVEADGTVCDDRLFTPGRYLVVEDPHGGIALKMNSDGRVERVVSEG